METPSGPSHAAWKVLSIVLRAAYAIGVLLYIAFYTDNFNTFQKIVVLLVALIIYATRRGHLESNPGWPANDAWPLVATPVQDVPERLCL